jgi:hypothetical protein
MTKVVSGLLSLALLPPMYIGITSPVSAQPVPAECKTMAQAEQEIKEAGGVIVGAANYHGMVTDSLIVVESESVIAVFGFKDGCMVQGAVLEPAVPQKDA